MKLTGIFFCVFVFGTLVARSAEESPTVGIFTGWTWLPYSYYGRPYRYGYSPYGCSPLVGIEHPLYGFNHEGYPGLCDPYAPYWGYGYSVRYRLKAERFPLSSPGQGLPSLPGSAPTEPLASEHKTPWDQAIDAFLKATNAPPLQAAAPQ